MERYKKFELSELLTNDGYVVVIEGDDDLYDDDWVQRYHKKHATQL